jgi:hypothetical protein
MFLVIVYDPPELFKYSITDTLLFLMLFILKVDPQLPFRRGFLKIVVTQNLREWCILKSTSQ